VTDAEIVGSLVTYKPIEIRTKGKGKIITALFSGIKNNNIIKS
jgi:hypothetical protein